jgi:hypothetical protein
MSHQPAEPILEIHSGLSLRGKFSMARDVIITGQFEGEFQTLGCLTVAAGAVVTGTVEAGALVLDPGHRLEASVKVTPSPASNHRFSAAARAARAEAGAEKWPGQIRKLTEMALGRK